jgi:hypothetical protein
MEYGLGFKALGKHSTGDEIELTCTPDGCNIRATRGNGSVSGIMVNFFGALYACPFLCEGYTSMKKGVEMMFNPCVDGHGLYDVLVIHESKRDDPKQSYEKHDYYSQETGMFELRHIYLAPGVYYGRGTASAPVDTAEDTFLFCRQYELVNSVYLPHLWGVLGPQTKYGVEERYSNYTNVELWSDS